MQLRCKQDEQGDIRRGSQQDKDEVRKSFQAAPEKYRKESSYLNADGINNTPATSTGITANTVPKVKDQIVAIIETLGEADESYLRSSSSSDDDTTDGLKVEFQQRKSSFSSIGSDLNLNLQEPIPYDDTVCSLDTKQPSHSTKGSHKYFKYCLIPYIHWPTANHIEYTGSHPITEVKQC